MTINQHINNNSIQINTQTKNINEIKDELISKYIPKMHPTDHMSTAIEYLDVPNKTSGALYQSVTICKSKHNYITDPITISKNKEQN